MSTPISHEEKQKMVNNFEQYCAKFVNDYHASAAHETADNIKEHYHSLKERITAFSNKLSDESQKIITLAKDPEFTKQIKEILKDTLKKLSE